MLTPNEVSEVLVPLVSVARASNGYVVKSWDSADVIEDDPMMPQGTALLWALIEALGLAGSRHDAKRLYVGWKAGDKHHDYHPQPCSDCECACDPDESTPEPTP